MAEPTTLLHEYRLKHPDYNDLEDDELLELMWTADYQDMPYDVFREGMGVDVYTEERDGQMVQLPEKRTIRTDIDKKLKSGEQFLDGMAPDELESNLKEFEEDESEDAVTPEDDDPGYFGNWPRRVGESAFRAVGDLFKGVSTAVEPIGREADVALAKLTTKPGPERNMAVRYAETRPNFFDIAADHMKEVDFGAREAETYDELEERWASAEDLEDYTSAFIDTVGWGLTEGVASIPDMVGAIYAMPAYLVSTDARIAEARAQNDGRENFTQEDMVWAAPWSVATLAMERLGGKYIQSKFGKKMTQQDLVDELGKGALERGLQVAKDAGKSAGMEGFTEAVQEGVLEYMGETLGTKAEIDWRDMVQRGFWGGVAGGTFGGTAGGVSSLAGQLDRAISGDRLPPEFETDPIYPDDTPPPGATPNEETSDVNIDPDTPIDEIGPDSPPWEDVGPEDDVEVAPTEPPELPRVPGDLEELRNQRRAVLEELQEIDELDLDDPDIPQATLDRKAELEEMRAEIDDEIDFASFEKYGPPNYAAPLRDEADELKAQQWAERNIGSMMTSGYPRDAELDELTMARARAGVAGDTAAASELAEQIRVKQNELLERETPTIDQEPEVEAVVEEAELPDLPDTEIAGVAFPTVETGSGALPGEVYPLPDAEELISPNNRDIDVKKAEGLLEMAAAEQNPEARQEILDEYNELINEMDWLEEQQREREQRRDEMHPEYRPWDEKRQEIELVEAQMADIEYSVMARLDEQEQIDAGPQLEQMLEPFRERLATLQEELVPLEREMQLGAAPRQPTEPPVDAPDPGPATPIEGVPEDWKYFDPRMRHPGYRREIEKFKRELVDTEDTVLGSLQDDIERNHRWTHTQIRNAVQKALEGKRLGTRQMAVMRDILDEIQAVRNDPTTIQEHREKLERQRQARRDRGDPNAYKIDETWLDDVVNNRINPNAGEDWAKLNQEEKLIANMAILLRSEGFDPEPILRDSNSVEEIIERLEEALHDYESGTEGLTPAEDAETRREGAEAREGLLQDPAEHPAQPGRPFAAQGFRAQGVAPEILYADTQAGYPLLGPARYAFFEEGVAEGLRELATERGADPDTLSIEPVNIQLENPYVIDADADWRRLAVDLAGNPSPNPRRFDATPEQRMEGYVEFANNIRNYLESEGFDGVVVQWDDASLMDEDAYGYDIKLLRNVFDQPQIISFAEGDPLAGAEEELDAQRVDDPDTESVYGTSEDPAYDKPIIDPETGMPVGPPAPVQDVEAIIEQLQEVFPDEDFLMPDSTHWPEMMEEMDVLGATPADVAAQYIQATPDEVRAIEEIYGQILLARANPTADTRQPDDQRERRKDQELRERIEAMTPEERFEALYIDELTGLGNKRYMEETMEDVPFFAFFDLDNLKTINTFLGHEGGDKLLQRTGEVMMGLTEDGQAFHPHGDEFILFGDSVEELEALAAQIDAELANSFVATPVGKLDGLSGTWGIDDTIARADREMEANKLRRTAMGLRTERGQKPPNLSMAGTSQDEIQKAMMPMQEGDQHVPLIGKYGDLPIMRDGTYRLSDGRRVKVPKRAVRKVHILKKMQQRFGLTIWEGRIKGNRTELGFYRKNVGEIRTKYHNDLEVTAHEIGHWFDDRYPWISAMYKTPIHKKELKGISYDVEKVEEGFAEYMRLWFTQEHKAVQRVPYFHDAFMSELEENHPDLYKDMRDLQEMTHAWYLQGAEKRFDSKTGNPNLPIAMRLYDARKYASDFMLQKTFDGFRSFKQVERDLRGFVSDAEFSPYKNIRMSVQSDELMEHFMERGTLMLNADRTEMVTTGESLKEALQGIDDQLDNFIRYAVAMRANELENPKPVRTYDEEGNLESVVTPERRESGFRPDEIRAGLAYGADPKIREAHARYLAWNGRMLDFYEDMGILNPKTREKFDSINQNYLPFNRVVKAFDSGNVQGGGQFFPRLTGSTRSIKDVLDSIVGNHSYLTHMALVNESKVLLYDMIDASPIPQRAANWAVKIEKDVAPVPIPKEQIEEAIIRGMGLTPNQYRLMKEGMSTAETQEEFEREQKQLAAIETAMDALPQWVEFWQLGLAPKGNVDVVYRQGEANYYEIPETYQGKLLLDSLHHTSPKAMNLTLRILAGFSGTLRRGVVSTPWFQVPNFMRDTLQRWTLLGELKKSDILGPIPTIVGATRQALKGFVDDADYWDYVAQGGGMSSLSQGEGMARKNMDIGYSATNPRQAWRNFLTWYDRKLGALEYGNRIDEYKRQIKLGKSKREAAFQGREVSSDFSMRGSSNTVRAATFAIVFLNARMQGGYRLSREVFEKNPRERTKLRKKHAVNYFIRAFTGITIPTLALYFYNRDDERWDQIPKDIRRMNWIIFYGEEEDDYLTIPKPFETGFFWASWFEEVLDYMYDNDMEEFAEGIRWLILETFAIDVIPQALKPFDELRINEKWTGAPIVPPYLDGVEASEQYKHYTSDAMVALARVLSDKLGYEVSPMMAQHVVEGYLGTMGQYGLSVADFFVQDMTNGGQEIAGPHRELDDEELFEAWGKKYYSDLPWDIGDALLLDRFIDHGPLRRTQQQKEFYELLREARTTASTVRLMQLRDPERLRAYLQQVDEAFYYGASADINSLAQQLNQIDQTIERVATNPQMSPIAKRQLIETYTRQRNLALKALSEKLDVDKYEEAMEVLNRMSPPPPDQEPPLN